MCRSIQPLHNYQPPTTEAEVRAAALQFVRKISGSTRPAHVNQAAFDRAVDAVSAATAELLGSLVATTPPHDRAVEMARRRARFERRQTQVSPAAV
jgi:hypothetical protein